MAKHMNTHIFKAKSTAEAIGKAKSAMGPNIVIVSHKKVAEPNLFSKLKLGGAALSVELEVAAADPEPEAKKPAAGVPNPVLAKSYAKALETAEKFGPGAKRAMAAAAAPYASVGEAAGGVAKQLEEMKRELSAARRENADRWDKMRTLVSLQARGGVPAVSPAFLDCYRSLTAAGVGGDLARDIAEKLQRDLPGENDPALVEAALLKELARRIPVAGPILPGAGKPLVVALVGASGVGKSTAAAKLAIQFFMRHKKAIGIINEDMRRPGAVAQLANIGTIAAASVVNVSKPEEIADSARSMAGKDLILLDTSGRSPRDKGDIAGLAEVLKAAGAHETHLLLSAVTSEKDLRHTVEAYAPVKFGRVILTKLDECVSPGVIVNVGADLAAGLSYVTTGADYFTRPIEAADQDFLAELILGRREIAGGSGDWPEEAAGETHSV